VLFIDEHVEVRGKETYLPGSDEMINCAMAADTA
jgi:hypothetical protein